MGDQSAGGGSAEEYTSDSWRPGGANSSRADREINRARDALASSNATAANVAQMNNAVPDVKPGGILDRISSAFGSALSPAKEGPTTFSGAQDSSMLPGVFNYVPDVQQVQNYLQQFTSADDQGYQGSSPSSSPSPSANRFQSGLATLMGGTPEYNMSPGAMGGRAERDTVPDFVRVGGGTAPLPARPQTLGAPRPSPFNINNLEAGRPADPFAIFPPDAPEFPSEAERMAMERRADYMLPLQQQTSAFPPDAPGLIDARQRPDPNEIANTTPNFKSLYGRGFTPEPPKDVSSLYGRGFTPEPPYDINNLEAGRPADPLGLEDIEEFLGGDIDKFYKGVATNQIRPKNEKQKTWFERLKAYGAEWLKGLLAGGPGGPGGGAKLIPFTQDTSHPYGGGGGGSSVGSATPMLCPEGWIFDPLRNACVPKGLPANPADPATKNPAPGTTAPATGGISNIPNVYPFTLTPPIGAPVGNLPPVRS